MAPTAFRVGPVARLDPGDEVAHGQQREGQRREQERCQPPFQEEQVAVDADQGHAQPG